jgi:hypothetical protein
MLENESLWETAVRCHAALAAAKIPHAVVGGVAVCLHGYQRNTVDLDLLVRKEDMPRIRQALTTADFYWDEIDAVFRRRGGSAIRFRWTLEPAGNGSKVSFPDLEDTGAVTEIEGLPVLTLAKLIESKIACAEGNLRRTHKDLADVVELIAVNKLSSSFARYLHKSLRPTFRELADRARGDD